MSAMLGLAALLQAPPPAETAPPKLDLPRLEGARLKYVMGPRSLAYLRQNTRGASYGDAPEKVVTGTITVPTVEIPVGSFKLEDRLKASEARKAYKTTVQPKGQILVFLQSTNLREMRLVAVDGWGNHTSEGMRQNFASARQWKAGFENTKDVPVDVYFVVDQGFRHILDTQTVDAGAMGTGMGYAAGGEQTMVQRGGVVQGFPSDPFTLVVLRTVKDGK